MKLSVSHVVQILHHLKYWVCIPSSLSEYKNVHLFDQCSRGDGELMRCEVFNFRDGEDVSAGSWRRIGDCPCSKCADRYPLCVNRAIYWGIFSGWNDKSILSFDLEPEEFTSSNIQHVILKGPA